MPKVKPAEIHLTNGTKVTEQPGTALEFANGLCTMYTVEQVPAQYKAFGLITKQKLVPRKTPIKSWSLEKILHVDWGWVDMARFQSMLEDMKKRQEADRAKTGDPVAKTEKTDA